MSFEIRDRLLRYRLRIRPARPGTLLRAQEAWRQRPRGGAGIEWWLVAAAGLLLLIDWSVTQPSPRVQAPVDGASSLSAPLLERLPPRRLSPHAILYTIACAEEGR